MSNSARQLDSVIEEKSNQLIKLIRKETEENDKWVTYKHRELPQLLDTSNFSVKKIIETVKLHPNIIFEEVERARSSRKPFQFKYVTAEEKRQRGLSAQNFYYLDQNEVDLVIERLGLQSYDVLYRLLSIVYILSRDGAKERFIKVNYKHLSDLFLISKDEMSERIDQLVNYRLLTTATGIADNMYMLLLSSEAIAQSRMMVDSQDKTFAPTNLTIEQMDNIEGQGISIVSQNDIPKELVDAFSNKVEATKESIKEFMAFCDSQAKFIADFYQTRQEEKEKLIQSYDSVNRLLEENAALKKQIKEVEHKNSVLESSIEGVSKKQNAREEFMQETFDVLIADIMHSIAEFTNTPPAKQSIAIRSRFERNVMDSVTKASDDIINFKPDSV